MLALLLIAMWVLVPAGVNNGQWGDHFEQFVWAHSLEWGYHKHPPLPTWLLAGTIGLLGRSPYWAYALAALCTGGTAYFSYRIARHLLPPGLVGLTMLLWGLQQAFSSRAQVFNHNTVLMLAVSATAWFVLQAVTTRARGWWWAVGVAAGAAMLSKYQAIVPLAGLLVGLLLTGELTRRDTRTGVLSALALAALMFAPHAVWMVQNDFTTLRYAGQGGEHLDWAARSASMLGFLLQQARLLLPALLFAGLLWMLQRLHSSAPQPSQMVQQTDAQRQFRRAWFVALIVFPLVITVLTCPAFGLKLQNHWGFQCLQFVALWLAWSLRRLARRPQISLAVLALCVQFSALALQHGGDRGEDRAGGSAAGRFDSHNAGRRHDTRYPAQALADAVRQDWTSRTLCPLRIVIGPSFEAGMISTYLREMPKVLEGGDYRKSPWIQGDEVQRSGAVYVSTDPAALAALAAQQGQLIEASSVQAKLGGDRAERVYWAVVPPADCIAPI